MSDVLLNIIKEENMENRKFWIVLIDGRVPRESSCFHYSFEEAKKEAERLMLKERCPAIVLEAIVVGKFKEQPIEWLDMEGE